MENNLVKDLDAEYSGINAVIDFQCEMPKNINYSDIVEQLPKWHSRVLEVIDVPNVGPKIKFKVNALTISEVKEWIVAYEEHTNFTYTIRSTEKCTGRYVLFKQRLRCHHNTNCIKLHNASEKNRTKNTNCYSEIKITLRAIKKRYQGKNKNNAPDQDMPCIIELNPNHNHSKEKVDFLHFRKLTPQTREKLLNLFKCGHSPTSALESLKIDYFLNNENFENNLAYKKFCPDYFYIYHLYRLEFIRKYGIVPASKEFLQERIDEYNEEMDEYCAEMAFIGEEYCICFCPPLFRRVHKYVDAAKEMVFIDTCGSLGHDNTHVFMLLTNSYYGGLPLAVILTSSETTNVIIEGFSLLKNIMGINIFGGNIGGPNIFMTDDSVAVQNAIKTSWPASTHFLCTFPVLQSVWRWLMKTKNKIQLDDQIKLYNDFKAIMYSKSTQECFEKYESAKVNAKDYPNYSSILMEYWNRKEQWALVYRSSYSVSDYNTNLFETSIRVLKDKTFHHIKEFNLTQLFDFISTRFTQYYERCLLDAAYNRIVKHLFDWNIKLPALEVLNQITIISESILLVPSEDNPNVRYMVNTDILSCTCTYGNTGRICKHVHWAASLAENDKHINSLDNTEVQTLYYVLATGSKPTLHCLDELLPNNHSKTTETEMNSIESNEDTQSIQDSCNTIDETYEVIAETEKTRGDVLIRDIANQFSNFLQRDPISVVNVLEKMNEALGELNSISSFCIACAKFGSEFDQVRRSKKVLAQTTGLTGRTFPAKLSGRSRKRKIPIEKGCKEKENKQTV